MTTASYANSCSRVDGKPSVSAGRPAAAGLDEKRVLPSPFLPLRVTASTSRPRVAGERPRQEAVLESGRAFDQQQPPLAADGTHEQAAAVVLADRLAFVRGILGGVDRGIQRIGRDGEDLIDRRSVGARHEAARVEQLAVGEHAQRERRAAEAAADGGHVQIDARVIEPRIAGGDAEHLAIARAVRRSDADGKHRRPVGGATRPAVARLPTTCPPLRCRRHRTARRCRRRAGRDSARAGRERAGEIGAARVGGKRSTFAGASAVAAP
jgi:hypothetical protein